MDNMKDKSIHFTTQKLTEEVQKMSIYKNLYDDVQKLVSSTSVTKHDFKQGLLNSIRTSGVETELRNTVFHWIRSHHNFNMNAYPTKEPIGYLRKAQLQWEKRIHKSLNSMCNEVSQALSRFRIASDRDELDEKWTELSVFDVDLSQYRPVYAPKDFLEVLLSLRSPNYRSIDGEGVWDFSQLPLKVKNLSELKSLYQDIARGEALLGVNPEMPASNTSCQTLLDERISLGEVVLSSNHAPVAQEFLKKGCPQCLRGKMWAQVLGTEVKQQSIENFNELKQMVLQYDMMVDKLIFKDVQLTASNDDQYFVFEDVLYQVMLCFSRDTEVLTVFHNSSSNPLHAVLKGKQATLENTVIYPPSGVIPFHGFTMYAAPFCYMYDDPVALYFTFRAFYTRYWFRLHEVSSHKQGILCLCLLFERLLQRNEPQLWFHFRFINIQPVQVVFKWLMRGFSGHLPPEQLLYLWDVVLAYDSLEVLPLLAASILSFRKESILAVDNLQSVEAVLADLSSLAVMPILQLTLMKDELLNSATWPDNIIVSKFFPPKKLGSKTLGVSMENNLKDYTIISESMQLMGSDDGPKSSCNVSSEVPPDNKPDSFY